VAEEDAVPDARHAPVTYRGAALLGNEGREEAIDALLLVIGRLARGFDR
jgi:hypothetical protein